jgi:hypothetical protein
VTHRKHTALHQVFRTALVPLCGAALSGTLLAGSLFAQGAAPADQKVESGKVVKKTEPHFAAPAIQVEVLDPGDVLIPQDFRVAVYENLIQELQHSGRFEKVYRSGDKNAAGVAGLVILRTTAESFKKGSEKERDVTVVAGATKIKINAKISNESGQVLMDRDVEGKVGIKLRLASTSNLEATRDFARKLAALVRENFMPAVKEQPAK